jgi:hypothetical protein
MKRVVGAIRYQPALTVAAVRSLDDGWLATVSLELAIAGDPAMEENTNPHLDGW